MQKNFGVMLVGIIGGIFALIGSLIVLAGSTLPFLPNAAQTNATGFLGYLAAVIGLFGAISVEKLRIFGGLLMLGSAFLGYIFIGGMFALGGTMLFIAGIYTTMVTE